MKLPKLFNSFTAQPPQAQPADHERAVPATLPGYSDSWSNNAFYQPFYLYNGTLYNGSTNTPIVTQEGLLSIPAAWACVNLIAHNCAVMLADADVKDPMGNEIPAPTICSMPNSMYGSGYEWWYEVITTLVIYGNYVAIVYGDELVPVHPSHVSCRINDLGMPEYQIGSETYGMFDILHIRHLTLPGTWWGHGVIEAQRLGLSGAIGMQNYARNTYLNGGVPSAVLKLDARNVPQATLTQLGTDWAAAFGNSERKPVVLPNGMDITPISWSPEDSQFLQSRSFTVAEMALMFGINPMDLTATIGGQNQTYANIGQANLERIKRSFAPWVTRVEHAWSNKLLPPGYKFCADPEALLALDPLSQAQLELARNQADQVAISAGITSAAEVRASRGLPPVPDPTPTPAPAEEDTEPEDDYL